MARLSFLVYLLIVLSGIFFARQGYKDQLQRSSLSSEEVNVELNATTRKYFFKTIPLSLLFYLLLLYAFYRITKPLGGVLARLQKFKDEIPFEKTLRLLYQKDEWAQIEAALNKADTKLQEQVAQVRSENEKISAILESIHDDIIAVDKFETVLFYNSNFRRDFIRERVGHDIVPKLWHKLKDEAVLGSFRKVLRTGETQYLKGLQGLSMERPERFFDLTITPLKDDEGKTTGALGVFYDVTDFKLTEQMRVDFVANVSHEIRTPLTSIRGYTQILQSQKERLGSEYQIFLDKIVSNTERMITLFNDLLQLSVIESKNLIKIEDLDLKQLLDSVTSDIMANHRHDKLNIKFDLQLSRIRGDHRLIEQVLTNLLDNACKYSGPDINIVVSSYSRDGKAYVVVKDHGQGISKEHLSRIFERFYRVDSSREESRGTGLGLSIVKHIIAKHGGRIWAESQEQEGTSFIIELPLE